MPVKMPEEIGNHFIKEVWISTGIELELSQGGKQLPSWGENKVSQIPEYHSNAIPLMGQWNYQQIPMMLIPVMVAPIVFAFP